ncbi:MAG: hypothetical protein J0L64_01825 [Acidobacteria bacterium]|nr:hypothetical protein [Acidobacteriota bacterium]
MNLKVVIAFLMGLVVALGVAVLVKRESPPAPPTEVTANQPPAPSMAEPAVPGVPVNPPPPTTAEAVAPPAPASRPAVTASPKPGSKSTKPSPMPAAQPKPEPKPEPAPAPVQTAKNEPAPTPAPDPAPAPAPEPAPVFRPDPPKVRVAKTITIPAGTVVNVRLMEKLSSGVQTNGDAFSATMDQPLIIDGLVIAERGSKVEGVVVEAVASGRVKGRASLGLELKKFHSSDGQYVAISTDTFRKEAEGSAKSDAAKVGAAAGIGAAIGAIAGGGKGAAIGAAIGGGAGGGGVLATRGKPAELAAETQLSFRLATDVQVTEKLK